MLVGAMRSTYSLALRALLFTGVALPALAAVPQPLAFEAAWQQLSAHSDRLAAAQAATEVKAQQGRGIERLGGPAVALAGRSERGSGRARAPTLGLVTEIAKMRCQIAAGRRRLLMAGSGFSRRSP
jgi:hypothetical protein